MLDGGFGTARQVFIVDSKECWHLKTSGKSWSHRQKEGAGIGGMLEMSNETSYFSRHLAKTIIWQIKWLNLLISALMSICASAMIEEALWLHGDTERAQVFPVASDLIYFWAAWFIRRRPDTFPPQRIPESVCRAACETCRMAAGGVMWSALPLYCASGIRRRCDWCSLFLSGVKFTKWCMD